MINKSLSNSQIFRLLILCFITGIVMANFIIISHFLIFSFILFFVFLLIVNWQNFYFRIISLFIIFLIIGIFRLQISLPDFSSSQNIYYYNESQVNFSAVVESINPKLDYQQLIVKVIANNNFKSGRVLLNLPLYPEYNYGETLKIDCQLKAPNNYDGFDYASYLSKSDIYSICSYPNIFKTNVQQISFKYNIFSKIYFIKSKLSQRLDLFVIEPEASLLQAMILGVKGDMPTEIKNIFSNVGLSHIIAISGLHIVIITFIIMQLSIGLGIIRQKSFWVATIFIVLYVIMIGFPASAVRGAIMALLFLFAQKIGRLSYSINALLLAGFLMLLINPKLLLFDVGFQLSFMAVLGLLYILPPLQLKLKKIPEFWQIKNIVLVTLSAQIMTQPLLILYFHKVSIISLLSNILVLPLIPFLMIWTFLNLIVGFFYLPLGYLMGYGSYLMTHYILVVATRLNSWPLAYLNVEINSLILTFGFYGLIVYLVYKNRKTI